jgi:hypothetical protein
MPREITFENKESIITKEVPRKNKCTAEDLNEIKEVVNENAQNLVTVSSTEPTGNNKNKVWFKKSKNLLPSSFYAYTLGTVYGYFKLSEIEENMIMSLTDKDTTVDMSGVYFGYSVNGNSNADGVAWIVENGTKLASTLSNIYSATNTKMQYFSFYPKNQATFNKIFSRFNIQIEKGLTVSPYESYFETKSIYYKDVNNEYEELSKINNDMYVGREILIGTWIGAKNLYRKVIGLGTMPNATSKNVAHGLTDVTIVRVYGTAYNTSVTLPLPYVSYGNSTSSQIGIDVVSDNIRIYAASDRSGFNGYAILEYIKNNE